MLTNLLATNAYTAASSKARFISLVSHQGTVARGAKYREVSTRLNRREYKCISVGAIIITVDKQFMNFTSI